MRPSVGLLCAGAACACSGIPPMRQHFEAGMEPYVVFVADAPDGRGDLYAMSPNGSDVVQLTFTRPAEWGPTLSPHGDVIAFLRGPGESDTSHVSVSLLNLLSGGERALEMPDSSGTPLQVAWSADGRTVVVRTSQAVYRIAAPPAAPVGEEVCRNADRACTRAKAGELMLRVGAPPFATIAPCDGSAVLCVHPDSGAAAPLAEGVTEAARWGGDSVAYIQGEAVVVRPLGPGRSRQFAWRASLANPRSLAVFTGPPAD